MMSRTKEEGDKAVDEIKREMRSASVKLVVCDLASMRSVQKFIKEFKGNNTKLDLLLNNAAVMKRKRAVTEDGFEMMFQVNYLSPFILMNSFVELLKNTSSSQVIGNGRPSNKLRLDMDDLQFIKRYQMYHSFFKTKLCLLFASMEFARRHGGKGISTMMAEPGPFKSGLVRDAPLVVRFIKSLMSADVGEAAEKIMYVITADMAKNGKIFKEREEWPIPEYWKDKDISGRLWVITEDLLKGKIDYR
jgi:NAD(P)-dependent dehydrogenase (short-subunit alcohol dehydrogenase family)